MGYGTMLEGRINVPETDICEEMPVLKNPLGDVD
jgi:hypothetical protein